VKYPPLGGPQEGADRPEADTLRVSGCPPTSDVGALRAHISHGECEICGLSARQSGHFPADVTPALLETAATIGIAANLTTAAWREHVEIGRFEFLAEPGIEQARRDPGVDVHVDLALCQPGDNRSSSASISVSVRCPGDALGRIL